MKNIVLSITAGIGAFIAIALLSFLDTHTSTVVLLMAPFGATAVLVFGVPESPLAQPKNVIFGHLITAFVGILFFQVFGNDPIYLALATGLAISLMLITKTTHPPAGANPLLIMLAGEGWDFLFTPVLIGAVMLVICGKLTQISVRKLLH